MNKFYTINRGGGSPTAYLLYLSEVEGYLPEEQCYHKLVVIELINCNLIWMKVGGSYDFHISAIQEVTNLKEIARLNKLITFQ